MNEQLVELKNFAKKCAKKLPVATFYLDHATEIAFAWEIFFNNPLLIRLQDDCLPFLYDEYMFGIEHSKKVAQDAAAIVLAEESNLTTEEKRHLALLAEIAGLLHDIQRGEDSHALLSAQAVAGILCNYPLKQEEISLITQAIAVHENRTDPNNYDNPSARLLCQALYDADKFRFGPDIFSTTMWLFCDYTTWPLDEIAGYFPQGIAAAKTVVQTFRTEVAHHYGPELIQQGIQVGEIIHRELIKLSQQG